MTLKLLTKKSGIGESRHSSRSKSVDKPGRNTKYVVIIA